MPILRRRKPSNEATKTTVAKKSTGKLAIRETNESVKDSNGNEDDENVFAEILGSQPTTQARVYSCLNSLKSGKNIRRIKEMSFCLEFCGIFGHF